MLHKLSETHIDHFIHQCHTHGKIDHSTAPYQDAVIETDVFIARYLLNGYHSRLVGVSRNPIHRNLPNAPLFIFNSLFQLVERRTQWVPPQPKLQTRHRRAHTGHEPGTSGNEKKPDALEQRDHMESPLATISRNCVCELRLNRV
jgi:hypothetical protein